jgi:hypothetical protein
MQRTTGDAATTTARLALASGNPAKISAAVAADPGIAERAAIREFDGGMGRRDAEIAALRDFLGDPMLELGQTA